MSSPHRRAFLLDPHMHVGDRGVNGQENWHGGRPDEMAQMVLNVGLDAYANTEHNKITAHSEFMREAVLEALSDEARKGGCSSERVIVPIMGAELTLVHRRRRYHVGVLFKDWFDSQRRPALPGRAAPLEDTIHALRAEYEVFITFNHPHISDFVGRPKKWPDKIAQTRELITSGLFDGVELVNGQGMSARPCFHTWATREAFLSLDASIERGFDLNPIGSSDAHYPQVVGACVTNLNFDPDLDDWFTALKAGCGRAFFNSNSLVSDRIKSGLRDSGASELLDRIDFI